MDLIAFIGEHFFQPDYFQFYIIAGLGFIMLYILWSQSKSNLETLRLINEELKSCIHELMIMNGEIKIIEEEVK